MGEEYVYECQWWVWKEPIICDKSLSCGAVLAPERHLDVCVTPRPPALFSQSVLYVFFLILGCTSGKTSAINPSICASMTFHLCACESVCFQETTEYLYQRIEITEMRLIRLEGQNV